MYAVFLWKNKLRIFIHESSRVESVQHDKQYEPNLLPSQQMLAHKFYLLLY